MTAPAADDSRGLNAIWRVVVGQAKTRQARHQVAAAMRHVLGLGPTTSWDSVGMAICLDPRSADELAGGYLEAHRALERHGR